MSGYVYFSFSYKDLECVSDQVPISEIAKLQAQAQALMAALGLESVNIHGYVNMEVC